MQRLCRSYTTSDDDDSKRKVDHFDVTNNSRVEHFFIRSHLDKYLSPSSASGRIGLDSFYCSQRQAFPARLLFTAASFPRQGYCARRQALLQQGYCSWRQAFPCKVTVHGGKLSP